MSKLCLRCEAAQRAGATVDYCGTICSVLWPEGELPWQRVSLHLNVFTRGEGDVLKLPEADPQPDSGFEDAGRGNAGSRHFPLPIQGKNGITKAWRAK